MKMVLLVLGGDARHIRDVLATRHPQADVEEMPHIRQRRSPPTPGGDRLPTQHAGRDRKRHRYLQMRRVVADPQLPCRPLVESVDDAELATAQLGTRPATKRL